MIPRWAIKPLRERLAERLAERSRRRFAALERALAEGACRDEVVMTQRRARRIFTGTLALLIALAAWLAIVSLPNLWTVCIAGFLACGALFRWSLMLVEHLPRLPCLLTDHVYIFPPDVSEPRCGRCGCSDYWPIRRTVGGYLERFASWIRARLSSRDLPF